MKNILIPLELNHSSLEDKVVEIAISHAQQLQSKCWLVHINPDSKINSEEKRIQYLSNCTMANMKEEHRKLQIVTNLFDEHKINNEGVIIKASSIGLIQEEIKALNIDFLILGNHSVYFKQLTFNEEDNISKNINTLNIPTLMVPENE